MVKGRSGFTRWHLGLCTAACIAHFCELASAQQLLPVAFCSSVGVFASFHVGGLMQGGFHRFIEVEGTTAGIFHVGNLLFHVLPAVALAALLVVSALEVTVWHGLFAALFHLVWGGVASAWTFVLDAIYLPMKRSQWHTMWLLAVLAETVFAPMVL
jgi:hypothetical protein